MTPPWVSPLVSLPADGATVFVRRLRWFDPPVLAVWNLAAGSFFTSATALLTIVGGTFDGVYDAAFLNPIPTSTLPGWGVIIGGIFLGAAEASPGNWLLGESDLVANAYNGGTYAAPAGPATESAFSTIGAPSWTGPTSMSIGAIPSVVEIPAWGINSWRPVS